jgi:hypothetical protein
MAVICSYVRRLAVINLLGAVALVVTIAMMAFLGRQGHELLTPQAPCRIVSLELAFTAQHARDIIGSWGGDLYRIAVRQVRYDFIFIAGYSWLVLYLGFKAAQRAEHRGSPVLARAARLAGYAGLLAGLCDGLENIGMLTMLRTGEVTSLIALLTSLFASTKFALLLVAALVALAAALWPAKARAA